MGFILTVRTSVLLAVLIFSVSFTVSAQQVREWLLTGSGGFTGSGYKCAVAAADSLHYACAGGNGQLALSVYLSDDGGRQWLAALTQMKANIDSLYQPLPGDWDARQYSSVARPSAALVLLAGSYKRRSDNTWYPFLLRSGDAGVSWDDVHLADSLPPFHAPVLVMQDARSGAMAGSHYDSGSASAVSVLRVTTDGGTTWEARPHPADYVSRLLLPGGGLVIVVSPGTLHVSPDLGLSWDSPRPLPQNTRAVCAHDGSLLWAASAHSTGTGDLMTDLIYRSDDGGEHWTKIYEGAIYSNFGINALDFCDATNGIAVGQWDRILRTTDGGYSWVKEYQPYDLHDPSMGAVCYPSTHSAVAVTMTGIITMTGSLVLQPPALTVDQGATPMHRRARWTGIDGASEYHLQLAEDAPGMYMQYDIFGTSKLKREWLTADTAMVLDSTLLADRDYFVRVRALDGAANSAWSEPVKLTTPNDGGGTAVWTTAPPSLPSLQCIPQPAREFVRVRVRGGRLRGVCKLRDQLGRCVRSYTDTMHSAIHDAGESTFSFDTRGLPSGIYFLTVPTTTGMQYGRILVRK
jgi:hypothetical protein